MEKKKNSKAAIEGKEQPTTESHVRIKRLLQDLEREFDLLLNENVMRK